ncbi:MAG TPA: nodulation protein NfeD [Candidatus Limnocylindrales bacterium]|nr:nodulation protein NfeD [Candidatus Limnocylindrales bacterium]
MTTSRRARPLRLAAILATLAWAMLVGLAGAQGHRPIVVLTANGVVDNVMAGYLAEGIAGAERDGAAAVIIQLDTPGGSLDATNRIVGSLLEARVPVIVWVAPAGGRAASAGTFITLAANLAYMAPGTNIGAASPINSDGSDIPDTLRDKVFNDTIAKVRAIAQERGRNEEWAVETVTEARSSAANEAVELGAVDGIAATRDEVIAAAHGQEIRVGGTPVVLDLDGSEVREDAMNPFQAFLHLLSDPNIAFILFTIGFYGLIFELQNPNFVTGILGALAIILALVGFGSLPLNVAGLLLLGLAVVLFALEATVASHGLLTVGGVVCFLLGASALYTAPGDPMAPLVGVALPLVAVTTITTAAFGFLIAFAAIRSRNLAASPGTVGAPVAIGSVGSVRAPLAPLGSVYVAGEEWSARTREGGALDRGVPVKVVAVDGLTLVVEPDTSSSAAT